jgi:hypothetical protein
MPSYETARLSMTLIFYLERRNTFVFRLSFSVFPSLSSYKSFRPMNGKKPRNTPDPHYFRHFEKVPEPM